MILQLRHFKAICLFVVAILIGLLSPSILADGPVSVLHLPVVQREQSTNELVLGKGMSLPYPNRVTNLSQLDVDWFYTWHYKYTGVDLVPDGIQFVPMVWGPRQAEYLLDHPDQLADSRIVLLFNECDETTGIQCVATPQEAAEMTVQLQATFPNRLWGSPAVHNFGRAGWLTEYLAVCLNCRIDFITFHYYAFAPCNTTEFVTYANSFKQFNKPLWLTEYGCLHNDTAIRPAKYQEWYDLAGDLGIVTIAPWTEYVPPEIFGAIWAANFVDENNQLTSLGQWYKNSK